MKTKTLAVVAAVAALGAQPSKAVAPTPDEMAAAIITYKKKS